MRILVADDHSIVRTALKLLLAEIDEDLVVVEAKDFSETLEASIGKPELDLIVLDLQMPGYEGRKTLQLLIRNAGETPVVVFSMLESPFEMRAVLSDGVSAYIPKSTDDGLIVNIIKLVLAGGRYIPPVLGDLPIPSTAPQTAQQKQKELSDKFGISPRQTDVLSLMAEGLSNNEISKRMDLSISTIKTHVTGILKAMKVNNRTQAVLVFKRHHNSFEGITPDAP